MLAGMRYRLLLSFLLVFFAAACWPSQAQINGVPASVTSLGFGGSTNPTPGVRASVTSLGPNGYANSRPIFGDCCANFFLPASPNAPLFTGHHHRRDREGRDNDNDKGRGNDRGRKKRDYDFFAVGEPVYIPYAVQYADDAADSADDDPADTDSSQVDYAQDAGALSPNSRGSAANRHATVKTYPSSPIVPVAAQPSTVLVFKDGHRSEVRNYAVVGNTLFDFAPDRTYKILLADLDLPATHRANDDRGVDFEIPTSQNSIKAN